MNYNAKAAYGIKGLIKVPELKDGEPNDFLTRLFFQVKANIAAEKAALQPQQEHLVLPHAFVIVDRGD